MTLFHVSFFSSFMLSSVHGYHAHKNIWTFTNQNNITSEYEICALMGMCCLCYVPLWVGGSKGKAGVMYHFAWVDQREK